MQIAFLGLGQMGIAIARLLLDKGHDVTVWNRTASAANPLVERGAKLASTPAEAVQSADVVFTMLFDDHAVEDVLLTQKTLESIPDNAIHISLSTISVALAERLEAAHTAHNQRFLSVPVFGRPAVAVEGKLWLVVAGASDAIAEVEPLFEAFSRGHTIVGTQPSQANAVKLAGNFMIASLIASLAEAFTVAESQGIDSAILLETINNALFQSAFVANYGKIMLTPPASPGATIKLGAKDTQLFRDAASETPTPLAGLLHGQLEQIVAAGGGDLDWPSGLLNQVREFAKQASEQAEKADSLRE
jgi:3-hydroxyisobutyrate dehydrogenase-like beta-hydroxyacid dehydrogenase